MSTKKTKNEIELQVIAELCVKIFSNLNAAQHYLDAIAETETTREISMTKTKIDEAIMWLRKYEDGVDDELDELNPHRV